MPRKNTTQIVCVADFFAKEGKTEELIDALHALIKPTHAEPGCLRYELNQRADDPRGITFIEKRKDRKVFDEHCATACDGAVFRHLLQSFQNRTRTGPARENRRRDGRH
jgi:quinol monooxygenase YgiN